MIIKKRYSHFRSSKVLPVEPVVELFAIVMILCINSLISILKRKNRKNATLISVSDFNNDYSFTHIQSESNSIPNSQLNITQFIFF